MKKLPFFFLLLFFFSSTLIWATDSNNYQTASFNDGWEAAKRRDYTTAFLIFKSLADKDDAKACFNLSAFYVNGWGGAKKDINKAIECYKKSGNLGMPDGFNTLGNAYFDGELLPKDLPEATKWYIKAAEQGLPSAQFNIANAYHYGYGVAINLSKAKFWYEKAAAQNIEDAKFGLEKINKFGNGVSYFLQVIAAMLAAFAFSFWHVITMLPSTYLLLRFKTSKSALYFNSLVAFVSQVYFWGAWSAYAVTVAQLNTQLNDGSNYWFGGLLLSILPLQICTWKMHSHLENTAEGVSDDHKFGVVIYTVITAALYAVFYFYPSFAQIPYGWLFNRFAFKSIVLGNFFQ